MPTVRGKAGKEIITVDIWKETYQYFKEKAEERKMTIVQYINEQLAMNIERDKLLADIAPNLTKIHIATDHIILYDNKLKRSFTIIVKDSTLVCQEDESTDCEHTHYAWALPELTRLDIKRPPSAPKH